jgi:hypothetical protein
VERGGSLYIGGCNDPAVNCTQEPALVRVPPGCRPYDLCSTTLWKGSPVSLLSLSVTGSGAYWTAYSANGTFASSTGPLDGGAALSLVNIPHDSILVAASGTTLYYTIFNAAGGPPRLGLYRASVAGDTLGPSTTLTTGGVTAFAVDRMNVYYTDASSPGNLYVCPHDGSPTMLAANVGVGPIVLDGSTLYVGGSSLRSVPIDGGALTTVVQDPGTSAMRGLALDETYFYWGDAPAGLSRAPRDGGSPEVLVKDTTVGGGGSSLAVDGRAIYWVDATLVTVGPLEMLAK